MNTNKANTSDYRNNGNGRLNKIAYRDGYIHGRVHEHNIQSERRSIRENNSAAKGLLMGITFAAIAGLLGATAYFLNHTNQPSITPVQTAPALNENRP